MTKTKAIVLIIFILYLIASANSLCSILSVNETSEIKAENTIAAELIIYNGKLYLFTLTSTQIQTYQYVTDNSWEAKEKISLINSGDIFLQSLSSNAGVIFGEMPESRIWIWSNHLESGRYHNLNPFTPIINLEKYQPVATAKWNSFDSIFVSDFIKGTDVFNGNIMVYRIENQRKTAEYNIPPFYLIKRFTTTDNNKWAVLLDNGKIAFYDEQFNRSQDPGLTCGCFDVHSLDQGSIIVTTSYEPFSSNKDKLTFYLLDKNIPTILSEIIFNEPIHSISIESYQGQTIMAVLIGNRKNRRIKLYNLKLTTGE